jgi:hypothetical protein
VRLPARIFAIGSLAELLVCVADGGALFAWGDGTAGQLGFRPRDGFVRTPHRVESLSDKEVRSVSCGRSHMCATVAAQWIRDDEAACCMRCKTAFTMMTRRVRPSQLNARFSHLTSSQHHCRNCGGVFCGKCTQKRVPLLKLGHIEPVRVCDSCLEQIASGR